MFRIDSYQDDKLIGSEAFECDQICDFLFECFVTQFEDAEFKTLYNIVETDDSSELEHSSFLFQSDYLRRPYSYPQNEKLCTRCSGWLPVWLLDSNDVCLRCKCSAYRDENTTGTIGQFLQSYSTRQAVAPSINRSKKPYLGFELEVLTGDQSFTVSSAREIVNELKSYEMLAKHDGSVDAEFVSKPLLVNDAIAKVDQCIDYLQPRGFTSWEGNKCGFHVHVNRKSIKSPKNLLDFFCKHHATLREFCGRTDDHYCRFDPNVMSDNFLFRSPRFSALNFINRHTIEIRGFRGSLNKARVHSYLKFADFLARYSERLHRLNWDDVAFLVGDDFLNQFLLKRELIDPDLQAMAKSKLKTETGYKKQLKAFNCYNLAEFSKLMAVIETRGLFNTDNQ